jgi:hypothetical protein
MSSNSSEHSVALTSLLPSTTYTLAYALPLLFLSIILTFSGAFLTLDRTRSFPPRYDTIPGGFDVKNKNKKFHWILEGGVGGIAAGYAFGGLLWRCYVFHPETLTTLYSPFVHIPFTAHSKHDFLSVTRTKGILTSLALIIGDHHISSGPMEVCRSHIYGH